MKYPDKEHRIPFFDEVLRRVHALPGVQSAAIAGNLPLHLQRRLDVHRS